MKKRYLKPQETLVYMNQILPILTGSGSGGTDEPVNPDDPSITPGSDDEPIEEGGAPAFFGMDDF
jgi:hypothetical protein